MLQAVNPFIQMESTTVVHIVLIIGMVQLDDNGIQIFHLWRYIVGYTVGNIVVGDV